MVQAQELRSQKETGIWTVVDHEVIVAESALASHPLRGLGLYPIVSDFTTESTEATEFASFSVFSACCVVNSSDARYNIESHETLDRGCGIAVRGGRRGGAATMDGEGCERLV